LRRFSRARPSFAYLMLARRLLNQHLIIAFDAMAWNAAEEKN
jgi:hypothetical protein